MKRDEFLNNYEMEIDKLRSKIAILKKEITHKEKVILNYDSIVGELQKKIYDTKKYYLSKINYYKDQIEEDRKYIAELLDELNKAKEKNKALESIDSATSNTDKQLNKNTLKNQFESVGIIGEYGVINNSNEISIQFGIKLWKFTFAAGPNISIPKTQDNKVDFGFRGSIGIWF